MQLIGFKKNNIFKPTATFSLFCIIIIKIVLLPCFSSTLKLLQKGNGHEKV